MRSCFGAYLHVQYCMYSVQYSIILSLDLSFFVVAARGPFGLTSVFRYFGGPVHPWTMNEPEPALLCARRHAINLFIISREILNKL